MKDYISGIISILASFQLLFVQITNNEGEPGSKKQSAGKVVTKAKALLYEKYIQHVHPNYNCPHLP